MDNCEKYLIKNKSNKYLLSLNTNKGNKFLGNFDKKEEACQKLKDFLKCQE